MLHNPMASISAAGRVWIPMTGDEFFLRDIEDPPQFFRDKRSEYTLAGLAADSPYYGYISGDTTHNCNLRCKFCFDDFVHAKRDRMTTEDFQKLISLAELVPDGMMFLSCLYEPFLHPNFLDLLSLVPEIGRKKCFFTTNLCVKRFRPEVFEKLAEANLLYFNISMDSWRQDVYEHLRVNADFDVFRHNLETMAHTFSQCSSAPPVRFISVALKSNADELYDLIKMTHERFGATQHEVRMPFELPHAPAEWAAQESLSAHEWTMIEDAVAALPYSIKVMPDGGTARYYGPPVLVGMV